MSPRPGRSLAARPARSVPLLVLLAACGSSGKARDARIADSDPPYDLGEEVIRPPRQADAREGLPSGSACDASEQCLSGGCPLGVCSEWRRALRIRIDTSEAGVRLRQTVLDFPLLVRLTPERFPFGQARPDGGDLRFVDETGAALSHEIERWDENASTAELWVNVPRIEANRRDNTVLLYWGNAMAVPTSDGASVFGAFASVLHMGFDDEATTRRLLDSSGHGNGGSLQNRVAPTPPEDGVAGPGLRFAGDDTYLSTPSRSSPRTTLSLWFRSASTTAGRLAGLATREVAGEPLLDRALWLDDQGRLSLTVQAGSTTTRLAGLASYRDDAWHLAVARFGDSGVALFVDGDVIADAPELRPASYTSGVWVFAAGGPGAPPSSRDAAAPSGSFTGSLDEVRILESEESDARIALAHATQRPDATAVSYEPIP